MGCFHVNLLGGLQGKSKQMHEASSPDGYSQDKRTSADVDIPDSKQPEEARAEGSREYPCNRANSLDVVLL